MTYNLSNFKPTRLQYHVFIANIREINKKENEPETDYQISEKNQK